MSYLTKYIIISISSALLFLIANLSSSISLFVAGWVATICFAIFTWLMTSHYASTTTEGLHIAAAICMTLMVIAIIMVFTVWRSFIPMYPCVLAIISVLLTMVYYYNRKATEATLIIIILAFINLAGYDMWSMLT